MTPLAYSRLLRVMKFETLVCDYARFLCFSTSKNYYYFIMGPHYRGGMRWTVDMGARSPYLYVLCDAP